jgi:uncharacterized protein
VKILLTGATGLIGSALGPFLAARDHRVVPLLRGATSAAGERARWDPAKSEIDLAPAGPLEAVIHLAGESIAQRWTPAVKTRLWSSRVDGTRLLSEALVHLPDPPGTLVCASATGFYGSRGDERLDETSPAGSGFLAELCQAWEAATAPAAERGIRVVHLRLGPVLTPRGGALAAMLPAFRLGLGARLGSGRQYVSWITLDDLLPVVEHTLNTQTLRGPVNAVSPGAVTNANFTRALAAALGRPAFCVLPALAVGWMFGEMGRQALLASARVQPARLQKSGFQFQHPELASALQAMLGRPDPTQTA